MDANMHAGEGGEHATREALIEQGLEISDARDFVTRNMTEIFSRPAVQQALAYVLQKVTSFPAALRIFT
jgi:hypothetical protein